MLINASILRITTPTLDVMGKASYAPAAETIAGLRCAVSRPTRRQQIMLGAELHDVTAAVRVLTRELRSRGLSIDKGDRIEIATDRVSGARTLEVAIVTTAVKAGMDNQVAFAREV